MVNENKIIKSKNFYLLVALISFFLINPLLTASHLSNIIMASFMSFIIFLSVFTVPFNRFFLLATWILGIITFASYWFLAWVDHDEIVYFIHFIFTAAFLSIITSSVIISIVKQDEITTDSLFGAVCGYILIGFTWSFIYLSIETLHPSAFTIPFANENIRERVDHFIYYSFETLTTLGYGDILAINSSARTFSWLEAAIGQIYLAVWISQLVALRVTQRTRMK